MRGHTCTVTVRCPSLSHYPATGEPPSAPVPHDLSPLGRGWFQTQSINPDPAILSPPSFGKRETWRGGTARTTKSSIYRTRTRHEERCQRRAVVTQLVTHGLSYGREGVRNTTGYLVGAAGFEPAAPPEAGAWRRLPPPGPLGDWPTNSPGGSGLLSKSSSVTEQVTRGPTEPTAAREKRPQQHRGAPGANRSLELGSRAA